MVNKKQPDIRFSGFTDDWEQCEINDFGKQTFGGGTPKTSISKYWDGSVPWIQSSDVKEDVLKVTNPKKRISEDAIKSSATKLIPKDSIAVVTRVGVGKLALMDYDYATSQDFLSISGLRLDRWFATYSLYNILKREKNAVQGTSIKGLTKNDLLTKKVKIPKDRIEQRKIGVLLKQFDESISLHQQELTTLKKTKQGFLQKMFPKKGEKVPEVRFPEFTDNWEEQKFEKIFDVHTDFVANGSFEALKKNVKLYSEENYAYMIRLQDASNNWKGPWLYTDKMGFDFLKKSTVFENDIIMSDRGTIGKFFQVPLLDKPMTISSNAVLLRSSRNDNSFIFYMLNTKLIGTQIAIRTTPGVQPMISKTEFKKISAILPSILEQEKIGSFFKQLDDTITLYQRELELLQSTKKAFLQKLFV